MTTLEESQLVLEAVSGWVFYQSQNDGIKAIDEVLLFDVESAAFANFNYLECAKQSCDDVCDLAVICFLISLPIGLKFKVDEFPQNVDQVPDNFYINVLCKLWDSQEHALHQWRLLVRGLVRHLLF